MGNCIKGGLIPSFFSARIEFVIRIPKNNIAGQEAAEVQRTNRNNQYVERIKLEFSDIYR
jgi:hypothetical protein